MSRHDKTVDRDIKPHTADRKEKLRMTENVRDVEMFL